MPSEMTSIYEQLTTSTGASAVEPTQSMLMIKRPEKKGKKSTKAKK
jgi:hypothetical protein